MRKYIFNDGTYQINYETNGTSKPHLTMDEFYLFAKEALLAYYRSDGQRNYN